MNLVITPGQLRVLREFLKDGADNATLAKRMYVDIETVKTQLQRINRRAGTTNRAELAVRILSNQFSVNGLYLGAQCRACGSASEQPSVS